MTDFRPLNPDQYYEWGVDDQDRLTILSECCSDTFSEEEEIRLLNLLRQRQSDRMNSGWG